MGEVVEAGGVLIVGNSAWGARMVVSSLWVRDAAAMAGLQGRPGNLCHQLAP